MNHTIYEQLKLGLEKSFVYVQLFKKTNQVQALSLDLIVKRAKLKHKNVFINKLVT